MSVQVSSVLEARQLTRTYSTVHGQLTVLDSVSLKLEQGKSMAIVGPSGSGKTTLLGLCAGLDTCTSGSIEVLGQRLEQMDEEARARFRRDNIGFVFQSFHLLTTLTALENVSIPLELRGDRHAADRAREWLGRVGLTDRADHYPAQLSGGEQQRVALARAFVSEPDLLFADEPTGNLDAATGETVESLLFELNASHGTALLLVTHDERLAARTDGCLRLRGGRVESDN